MTGRITPLHKKCFDAMHTSGIGEGIVPTASISLSKLGSQKWWNYLWLTFTIVFLSIGSFFVIKQQGVNIWEIAGVLVFACFISYFPIANLVTIRKIGKLP